MMQSLRLKLERSLTAAVPLILILGACTAGSDPTTTAPVSTTLPAPAITDPDICPDRFCVVYHIRPEASWSDGAAVSAADFIHTYQLQESSEGYQLISGHQILDDKTVLFAFSEPYGPWQTLFAVVLPAHVEDPLSVSAGPFLLDELGEEVVLVRNPEYWGDVGEVERVYFIPTRSVRDGLRRLQSGELDLIHPPALDWVLSEIQKMEGVEVRVGPGPIWEHLDFNLDDPLLGEQWVRRAINSALNRTELVGAMPEIVFLGGFVLNSAMWPVSSVHYAEGFPQAEGPDVAIQTLSDHGCLLGDDEVYVCDGSRMSFVYATTIGDPWRRAQFELIRDALAEVGIELVGKFLAPADLFAEGFLFGSPDQWQIVSFPWSFSADPHLSDSLFLCSGSLNVNRFCDPEVEALIRDARAEIDPARRVGLYQEADLMYLAQIPMIPIYQRPVVVAWNADLVGPEPDSRGLNDLWNIASWTGASEVRIGIDRVPTTLDPLVPGDAALVRGGVSGRDLDRSDAELLAFGGSDVDLVNVIALDLCKAIEAIGVCAL